MGDDERVQNKRVKERKTCDQVGKVRDYPHLDIEITHL